MVLPDHVIKEVKDEPSVVVLLSLISNQTTKPSVITV